MAATSLSPIPAAVPSTPVLWTSRTLSALVVLFLIFDGVTKILKVPQVIEATVRLGYPESAVVAIGIIVLACTLVYAIPHTSIFGAILLTAYLGGAVASQIRISAPAFDTSFPIIFCVLIWAPLFLREPRLRAIIPVRS
ncbi:MAG TPA: DoxX family protein [Bryobacteraceae bacterium]|nr:DoxX family protein [Bryobacteraceae bacterium]